MAEWRFGRGWTESELAERLAAARRAHRNFDDPQEQMTPERGWNRHHSQAVIGHEPVGSPVPEGAFARAWPHVERFAFSDPRIVQGHFDPGAPLLGRVMLLEVRVLGLHYLGAAVVSALVDETDEGRSSRGFRYDTLQGHFERGSEWFIVSKDHRSGTVTFTIHAGWQRGELPNLWSRVGFRLLARRYQRAWHRLAHQRMRALIGSVDLEPLPRGRLLLHDGPPLPVTPVQEAASGSPPAPITFEYEAPTHHEETR